MQMEESWMQGVDTIKWPIYTLSIHLYNASRKVKERMLPKTIAVCCRSMPLVSKSTIA